MAIPPLSRIDLPFLAPIAAGHEILAAILSRPSPENQRQQFLVLDQRTGILYCDMRLGVALGPRATLDPIGILTRQGWVVQSQTIARVASSVVMMVSHEERTELRTRIHLDTQPDPYR